ncbi:hypothetical protein Tco_0180004 [Tanacetum coccineum]
MASFVQPSKVKINTGPVKNSFVSVLKSNDHKGSPSSDSPAIVMDDSCIVDNDLSCSLMGKIKDINALSNIYVIFADEGFDNVNISYLGGFWILIEACSVASKEKMLNHEGLASWFSELCIADPSFVSEDRLRNNQNEKSKDAGKSDPSFPPGFTPKGVNETIEEEENLSVISLRERSFKLLRRLSKTGVEMRCSRLLRISLLKDIHDLDKRHSSDFAQKAKIQWAIEGDENSKYFHGIINKKQSPFMEFRV